MTYSHYDIFIMLRKATMSYTERPEFRRKHMRNIDDVVDGFLLENLILERYRRT